MSEGGREGEREREGPNSVLLKGWGAAVGLVGWRALPRTVSALGCFVVSTGAVRSTVGSSARRASTASAACACVKRT